VNVHIIRGGEPLSVENDLVLALGRFVVYLVERPDLEPTKCPGMFGCHRALTLPEDHDPAFESDNMGSVQGHGKKPRLPEKPNGPGIIPLGPLPVSLNDCECRDDGEKDDKRKTFAG